MRQYHNGTWAGNACFIFGSNLSGIHGAGAAKFALSRAGAMWGHGVGIQGNSYAIPTKDKNIRTLPLDKIMEYVDDFIAFAQDNFEDTFFVTAIGTGLAGYSHADIAPMFKHAPDNCILPVEWKEFLE